MRNYELSESTNLRIWDGFTLIEVVMASALLFLVFGLGAPLLSDGYRDVSLRTEVGRFVSVLRRAESFAFSNHGASPYGVFIDSDSFVLFRGSSYALRDFVFDESFSRSSDYSFSGPSEIVFSRHSGFPSVSASWLLLRGNTQVDSISINEYGSITW